jgi:hypothetical protein
LFNSELEKDGDIDINDLLSVLLRMRRLISTDIMTKLTHKLFPLFSEEQPLQNFKTIYQSIRFYSNCLQEFICPSENSQRLDFPPSLSLMWDIIISKAFSSLPLHVDNITPSQYLLLLPPLLSILEIRTSYRVTFNQFVHVLVKKILTELENEQISISDRIFSIHALSLLGKKRLIMNERYRLYLDQMNFTDIIFFIQYPTCFNLMNDDLVLGKILDHFIDSYDKISNDRIMKYFCVYMQDNRLRSHVLLRLSKILRDNCYTNESVCKISGWIIAFCYDNNVRPPKFMMKKLLTALPNSTLRDIRCVLYGFEQVPKPWNRDFYKDLEIIHETIVKSIETQLQDRQSISFAIQTMKILYLLKPPGLRIDNIEMLKILRTLPALVKHIKMFEFVKILKTLSRLSFYDEQFLQSLESFAIQNHIYMTGECIERLLSFTFEVGYEINKELATICINKLELNFDNFSLDEQIYYVYSLSKHQIYPEKHIAKIFSLEYLKVLDAWMSGKNILFCIKKKFLCKAI